MDLLERDHYFAQLVTLAQSAKARVGQTVLISGEAGIGKTALVEAFLQRHGSGYRRLWGACEALFTPRPLGPLYDIAIQTQGAFSALINAGREVERPSLFSAFLEELQKSVSPTIVVFEDVHWADEATLDFIKFLGRRISHLPALFLVTYREHELSLDHPLWSVIGDLPGKAVTRLSLAPLSEQAVIHLANQAHRSAENLHAITGGNPFFVTEVLASDTPGVPLMVRDAVLARLQRLPPEARPLLELASVVPARIEYGLLEAILGSTLSALLEECLTSGMFTGDQTAVAFRHEIARQAVEEALSPLRRQALHLQILQTLRDQGEDRFPVARLVHHAAGACREELVARYAPLAAEQAAARGAHREAAAQYAAALQVAEHFSPEQQGDLLEGRAYECYLTSQMEEAEHARLMALQIWRQLGRSEQVGHTLRWLSRLSWFLGKSSEAERYAEEAVQVLEAFPSSAELAMAYSNRAQLAMLAERAAEAVQWGERAIYLAEPLGETETVVHALNNMGAAQFITQDQRGRIHLERSLQLALAHGWEEHVARAYTNLACCAVRCRDYALAEHFLQEGMTYCMGHDLDSWETYMRAWKARARFEQGNWDEAAAEAGRVLAAFRCSPVARIPALVILSLVRIRRGDPGWATLLDEARTLALTTGEPQRIVPVAVASAEAAWLRGDQHQCLAEARRGYELEAQRADLWALGELMLWMWRVGERTLPSVPIAEPFAQQIAGDWRSAAAHWAQIGCPYEQALALAQGDEDAQRKALALLELLGAQPALALLRQQARKQGKGAFPRGPRPSTRTNQAGLTLRQREVLELLAEGLPNAEIANRLSTAPKTVDHHVSAILAKLGVHSRTQAVATAYERKLLSQDRERPGLK